MNKILRLIALAAVVASCSLPGHAASPVVTQKVIDDVASKFAPDRRQIVYDIKAVGAKGAKVKLQGKISEAAVLDSLYARLKSAGIAYDSDITLLPSDKWALPRISVANVRVKPGHGAELSSQALMGMPVRVLEHDGDWYRIQTPDGYLGWIVGNSLAFKDDAEMNQWRQSDRVVVTSTHQTRMFNSPTATGSRDVVSDLVNGDILVLADEAPHAGRVKVIIPDGRTGWVKWDCVTPINEWADQDFDAEKILDMAYSMEGQPYLWGGTSTKSLDCSGLAKVSYLSNGIILRRDASQQALTGKRIEASDWRDCQAGDLLFFGNADTRRVTHVAIYDHDGNYVHSSGRVKRNSVDPSSPAYLTTPFLHAVRIHGFEGTDGIIRAIDHPWYFNR